jgi:protein tyrosine/serine phosphatase
MLRLPRKLIGIVVVGLLIAGPVAFALHDTAQVRNFHVFREGVLYRSGQLTLEGLKRVLNDYDIRTVISLRDAHVAGEPPPDQDEERFCRAAGLNYHRLPPRHWWAAAGPAPVEENVRKFRQIMADRNNYPVLIHCCAGIHRTGAYCAIYRMECEHWSNAQALDELHRFGYEHLYDEWDILTYLEDYRPSWKEPPEPVATTPPARKQSRKH